MYGKPRSSNPPAATSSSSRLSGSNALSRVLFSSKKSGGASNSPSSAIEDPNNLTAATETRLNSRGRFSLSSRSRKSSSYDVQQPRPRAEDLISPAGEDGQQQQQQLEQRDELPLYLQNIIMHHTHIAKPQHDTKLMKKLSKSILLPEDPSDPTAFTVTPGLTRPPKPPWCSNKPVLKIVGTFAFLMSLGIIIAILYMNCK